MQKDVAKQLGVHIESLKNWEHNIGRPLPRQIPRIVAFLGYDPEPIPQVLAKRIVHARRQQGLTQNNMAKALGVDPVTVYRWEKALTKPSLEKLQRLEALLPVTGSLTPQCS